MPMNCNAKSLCDLSIALRIGGFSVPIYASPSLFTAQPKLPMEAIFWRGLLRILLQPQTRLLRLDERVRKRHGESSPVVRSSSRNTAKLGQGSIKGLYGGFAAAEGEDVLIFSPGNAAPRLGYSVCYREELIADDQGGSFELSRYRDADDFIVTHRSSRRYGTY